MASTAVSNSLTVTDIAEYLRGDSHRKISLISTMEAVPVEDWDEERVLAMGMSLSMATPTKSPTECTYQTM